MSIEDSSFSKEIYYGLKEFIDTEKSYIEALKDLVKFYEVISKEYRADPEERLVPYPEDLKSSQIKLIFGQASKVLRLHSDMVKDFDPVVRDPRVIFATLSRKKLLMKRVYGDYCIGLAKVNSIIEEFRGYFTVIIKIAIWVYKI